VNVPWSDRPWRRVLVYGLGLSGLAAAAFLRRRGVTVVGVDARPAAELELGPLAADPEVSVLAGEEPRSLPGGIDAVVLSPGVPGDRPLLQAARAAGLPVIAEVELAFPWLEGPVVGVTGSNGKSTTTAMTGHLLRAAGVPAEVCGNIGLPLSEVADGAPGRVFVVELSSFQLESTDLLRPRAAALLNLSPDHLDRYPGMAEYAAAKRRIFLRQDGDDVAVLNADDPAVAALAVPARRRLFSRRGAVPDGLWNDGGTVLESDGSIAPARPLFVAADVPLPGPHHLENAMAAALLAMAVGAPREAIPEGLRGFRGLPHRTEPVAELGGVRYFDDSKGTNVGATARALEGFPDGSVHLILGGRGKGTGLGSELIELVRRKVRRAYLIGEEAARFRGELDGVVPWHWSERLAVAVPEAAAAARPGEVVLLSPACASFDQYRNYHHRGEHFQELVRGLAAAGESTRENGAQGAPYGSGEAGA
jgi:UDP-N-acetylmuramoylalanine--D-glutamate ligase